MSIYVQSNTESTHVVIGQQFTILVLMNVLLTLSAGVRSASARPTDSQHDSDTFQGSSLH